MDEKKLSFNDTILVLESVQGQGDAVLIGGQALNCWCGIFGTDVNRLGPFVSKDVDFQGDRATAERCAARLGGSLSDLSPRSPKLAGIVYYQDSQGVDRQIDFLTCPHGFEDAEKVAEASVPVPVRAPSGVELTVKVMHPIHCLQSRVHNVVGLPGQYANEHGIRQVKASMACARTYLQRLAHEDWRKALKENEKIFQFALTDVSSDLHASHGIEVFDVVLCEGSFPEKFKSTRYPQMQQQVALRRAKRAKR